MADLGAIPAFVIGLREGIEAALIIGILLAYLTKIGQRPLRRYVLLGTAAAVAASLAVAGILFALSVELEGTAEELFEGFATLLAVIVLTSMVLWMLRAARSLRQHFERRIDLLVDKRQMVGLFSLAFIAVFREGVETVLFTAGQAAQTTPGDAILGVLAGLTIAAVLGFGIFALSWRINLRRFFQVTSAFLVIIAAGLFMYAVHELQEAYQWGLDGTVYDAKAVLPDKVPEDGSDPSAAHVVGALLRGVFGYNDNPTQLEVVAYAAYWVFITLVYWGMKTGKIAIVTRPLQAAWRWLARRIAPSRPVVPGS
jgi:high-affinity iron transporter